MSAQDWVEMIYQALLEEGLDSTFYPYGEHATCVVSRNHHWFNIRVALETCLVIIRVQGIRRRIDINLSDPRMLELLIDFINA